MNSAQPSSAAITARLGRGTMWRVACVDSTGSTNADVATLARAGETEGYVLVASEQTRGRGRLARTWASPRGASVAISVLLEPRQEFLRWGWLSLLAGMAVQDAIAALAGDPDVVELKWPNDVLLGGRKVCGILSERVEHPSGARAVVGMGINLTLGEDELPVPTATSLTLAGIRAEPDDVVAAVLRAFQQHYRTWQDTGDLRHEYRARCASVGSELEVVVDERNKVHGTGVGVDELGRLEVITDGRVRTFAVGDVIHARMPR